MVWILNITDYMVLKTVENISVALLIPWVLREDIERPPFNSIEI